MRSQETILRAATVFTGKTIYSPGAIAFRNGVVTAVGRPNDVLEEGPGMRSQETILRAATVFTGKTIYSPGAIAFRNGVVTAVGRPNDVLVTCREHCEQIDYGDAFICAGFHDAHMHFFHSALYGSDLAESYLGESEVDCVARLAPLAARRPEGWLLTQGWREYRWNPARTPSRDSLDAAYPDRPVAMYSGDAHTLWLNTRAMEELDIREDSEAGPGGSFDRDESGRLTGIVREAATMELMPRIVASFSSDELAGAYRSFIRKLASRGITSISDMSLMAQPGLDFVFDNLFSTLEKTGELDVRVHMFPTLLDSMDRLDSMRKRYRSPLLQACGFKQFFDGVSKTGELDVRVHMFPTLLDSMDRLDSMRKRYRSPLLQACGFKQFFDGVSSQHTAWLAEPYANARAHDDCGRPTVDPDRMRTLVMNAARAGHAVRIHTIGDAAIHGALDIFEEAIRAFGQPAHGRHALEHLENFQPDDIARLAELGVIASVQPAHITLDPGGPERDLGEERAAYMWPFATLLRTGCTLAFGSDSPVVDPDPMQTLYAAVARKDPETHLPHGGWLPSECIGIKDALRAAAEGGAWVCGRERELGLLEPGYLADLCVLDRNLLGIDVACNPESILETRVLATYLGGRPVFIR